jgi:adenylate cyclase
MGLYVPERKGVSGMTEGEGKEPVRGADRSPETAESGFRAVVSKLRRRRIIETLAAFIGGSWLLLEFVHWILVDHYHFPEKAIDITFVTLLGALFCTLIWRWFSGAPAKRKLKPERILIPLVVIVTALIDLDLLVHLKTSGPEPVPAPKWANSVAVLPFVDMSPQRDQEYFCDGMTEELINRLSNIRQLKVPARTSAFFFKGKAEDIQEVGRKLKVNTVLEGSVRRAGNGLRVTAQLINCADGYHLWSETYDRELKDVFALQDEISLAIIDRLRIELLGDEKARLIRRYTEDHEAYDSYMKGLWLLHNKVGAEDWLKAIGHFERAIEMDEDFLPCYAGLAQAQIWLTYFHFVPTDETIPKAKEALRKAQKIDPAWPEALIWLGLIKFRFEFDWRGGESDIRKALESIPEGTFMPGTFGDLLMARGQFDRALEEFRRGVALDPLSPYLQAGLGWNLYMARRYDEALEQCEKAFELDADFPFALEVVGLCHIQESRFPEAIAVLRHAIALPGSGTEIACFLAYAYAVSRDPEKARGMLAEIEARSRNEYVSKYYLAAIHAALEDMDEAFGFLEMAYREKDGDLFYLNIDLKFGPMRADPRFGLMLKKLGFGSD